MFKRDPNPTFPATVQITVPGGTSQPLAVVFKHKTTEELAAFLAPGPGKSNAAMLADMIASVDIAAKQDGESDADFLAYICGKYPAAASDMLRTYLRELTESKVKN